MAAYFLGLTGHTLPEAGLDRLRPDFHVPSTARSGVQNDEECTVKTYEQRKVVARARQGVLHSSLCYLREW